MAFKRLPLESLDRRAKRMRGFNTPQQSIILFGVILLLVGFVLLSSGSYLSWPTIGALSGAVGIICLSRGALPDEGVSLRRSAAWLAGLIAYSGWLVLTSVQLMLNSANGMLRASLFVAIGIALLSCAFYMVQLIQRVKSIHTSATLDIRLLEMSCPCGSLKQLRDCHGLHLEARDIPRMPCPCGSGKRLENCHGMTV